MKFEPGPPPKIESTCAVVEPPPAPTSPPPFSPPSGPPPPPMVLHYDASLISGVTDGDNILTSGDSLASLADSSGQGNSALKACTDSKPAVYAASAFNGNPAIYLDGHGDRCLKSDSGPAHTRKTMILVFKEDPCNCAGTCGAFANYLWDFRPNWDGAYAYTTLRSDSWWQASMHWLNGAPADAEVGADGSTNPCSYFTSTGSILVTEASGSNSGNSFYVGAFFQHGGNSRLHFGEYRVYDSTLSATEREAIECQLSSKWGVPLAAGHPCA